MTQNNILLESGTNELEIVEFYLNEEGYRGHYGLNVAKVVEIIRRQKVTVMPEMSHPAVVGAFAHRTGRIVPLIDIAKFLGSSRIENVEEKVIVTEFNNLITSFLVSGVNRIYRLSWTDVEAPGKFLQQISHSSVTGVVRLEDRVIFLLDVEAIVAELHPAMAIRMDAPDEDSAPLEATKYRILHVDDSGSIRRLVLNLLEQEGRFEIVQAVDGQDAWDLLTKLRDEAQSNNMAISSLLHGVISDIEMPCMDGLTLCRKIKEDPILKQLPVAMFSSMISDSLVVKCQSVGADAQFAKPDLKSLSDKMYECVKTFHV
ncbi:MAG: chemotaxis protein [Desulfovibrionaceae bacterium]